MNDPFVGIQNSNLLGAKRDIYSNSLCDGMDENNYQSLNEFIYFL